MLTSSDIATYIRSACAEVFSTMLGIEIEAGSEREEQTGPDVADGILAFIGLAGPWAGAGAISCSASFACKLSNALLMGECTCVNEEVLDAMGELSNMIIGSFKTMAEERLGPLGLAIPTVIYGRNFMSRGSNRHSWVVVPFHSGSETLEVRVCLAPGKDSTAAVPTTAVPTLA
jgi:chemotaxis protein CheX